MRLKLRKQASLIGLALLLTAGTGLWLLVRQGVDSPPPAMPTPAQETATPVLAELLRQQTAAPARQTAIDRDSLLAFQAMRIDTDHVDPASPLSLHQPAPSEWLTPRSTLPLVIQFRSPPDAATRREIEDEGLLIRGYIPNNAFLVEAPSHLIPALRARPDIRWMGHYIPALKIEPFLKRLPRLWSVREASPFDPESLLPVTIQSFAPEDADGVANEVSRNGGRVLSATAGRRWGLVRAEVPWRAIEPLAQAGAVQWIELYLSPRLVNNVAVRPDMMNVTNVWLTHGLTASNQVIGHADTGLDVGALASLQPDLLGQVKAAIARGRPGNWSDPHGHGTHTAGSILGKGVASGGGIKGVAFGAQLVHQSILDAFGSLGGIPADLNDLFDEAYALGARIHSDSWGSPDYGRYTTDSRQCDEFVWDHPDMLLVFSAGNDGADGNADGVVDADSIGSPATAKSVLTVGASESDRPPGSGGYSSYSWSGGWPADFPVNPIASDKLSQPADLLNPGMAGFSSRGPTDDLRTKPDIVAPGVNILSCRSLLPGAGTGWGIHASNTNYVFSGGTSMSTPLTAGAAAIVREFYATRRGIANPPAALLKARLLAGARSLSPGQYGAGSTQEIPDASPNNVEGFGQVDLERTLFPAAGEYVAESHDAPPIQVGSTNRFSFQVSDTNTDIRLVLAWSDFPATPGVAVTLVNDLDLSLVAPGGTRYLPVAGSDHVNTAEKLVLTPTVTGVYTAEVTGIYVPQGPQPYALVVSGPIRVPPTIVHTPLPNTFSTNTPYTVSAHIHNPTPFDTNSVFVLWNTTGPTGTFNSVIMTQRVDGEFAASLPAQPVGTTLFYHLSAGSAPVQALDPAGAPATVHSFSVVVPRALFVAGSPANLLSVNPPYGTNMIADGVDVTATAPACSNVTPTMRIACAGWTGTGSVPPSGATTNASFTLTADSGLTWNWVQQYPLSQTSSVPGILATQTWWTALTSADTLTAPSSSTVTGIVHRFAGWAVDGLRQPDDTSVAVNPVTGMVMWTPRNAQATYLPQSQDADGDGLPDWWELYYFGTTNTLYNMDNDDDGFTNLKEYQDNTNPRDAGDSPQPPAIAFSPLADPNPGPAPWTVRSTVTDNGTIASVSTWWNRNDTGWQQATMLYFPTTGDYAGSIPAPGTNGDSVIYRIEAIDAAGLKAVSGPYSFDVRYPEARVAGFSPGPYLLPDASMTNILLVVSNVGLAELEWNISEHVFFENAELGANGWTHGGNLDIWHLQSARFSSASNAWHFGNGPGSSYNNLSHASLVSPAIALATPASLTFRHWANMEYDDQQMDNHFWDGGVVELSTNAGASFFGIAPVGGYPHRITSNPDSPFPPETPCYGSTSGRWAQAAFDLTPWTNQTVQVRFRFGADRYVVAEGWYIDDLAVTPLSGDIDWLVSPAAGTLEAGAVTNISITLSSAPLQPAATRQAALRLTHNSPIAPTQSVHSVSLHNTTREILVTSSAHGTVDPASGIRVNYGGDAPFLFTSDPYCRLVSAFTNGMAVAGLSTNSPATWTWSNVTANGTLVVNFDWILTLGNTPLWWLALYGLTNAAPEVEAVADPDGDGLLTWQEYRAGTIPTNALSVALFLSALDPLSTSSVPHVYTDLDTGITTTQWVPEVTGFRLEWLSFTNADYHYEIWSTTNLLETFTPLFTNIPATPPVNTWSNWDLPPAGRQFFRVHVIR